MPYFVMLENETFHFRSINDRLKLQWNRLLSVLTERSEEFWLDMAVVAFRQQQYNHALVNVYQALSIRPNDPRAYKLCGMIIQSQAFTATTMAQHETQIKAMLAAYERVMLTDHAQRENIERRLKHIYYYEFKRGVAAFHEGYHDEDAFALAAAYFKLAALIRPVIQGEMAAPDMPWGAAVNQALAHLNAGQPLEAREALETAVERGNISCNAFLLLAGLYAHYDQHEKGVHLLELARHRLPEEADTLEASYLNACLNAGRLDEVLTLYAAAVIRNPNDPDLRFNYGTLLIDQEDFDAAIEHLTAALKLAPSDVQVYYNLGTAYINKAIALSSVDEQPTDQQKTLFKQAILLYEKALHLPDVDGEENAVYQALFFAYDYTNQPDKAEALAVQLMDGQ